MYRIGRNIRCKLRLQIYIVNNKQLFYNGYNIGFFNKFVKLYAYRRHQKERRHALER